MYIQLWSFCAFIELVQNATSSGIWTGRFSWLHVCSWCTCRDCRIDHWIRCVNKIFFWYHTIKKKKKNIKLLWIWCQWIFRLACNSKHTVFIYKNRKFKEIFRASELLAWIFLCEVFFFIFVIIPLFQMQNSAN